MNSVSLIEDIQVIWITVNFQGIGTFEIYEYEVVCSILNNFLMSLVYTMIIPLLFRILIIWVFLLVSMARGLYIFIAFFFFKESTFGFVDKLYVCFLFIGLLHVSLLLFLLLSLNLMCCSYSCLRLIYTVLTFTLCF